MKRSTALLLALAIVLVLVANSADFFFHTPFWETWDSAANSLSVDRAKHLAQLHGPYSRWGFYHPGPALFYIQALGEWLFFDWLGLTPAPFNAQTLLYLFVSVGFYVAALRVFSRWLPAGRGRWWFVCGALLFAILHFTRAGSIHSYDPVTGPNVFFSLWSAHVLALPFLCLLVAGASVAAGGGEDLPLLALADGFLLQTHVAQPLFVFPLTGLALAGLVWRCAGEQRDRVSLASSWRDRLALRLGAGWHSFRRAHVLAAVILAFFALPVVIDLGAGEHSNLAAIVNHLRLHHGEHKPLAQSVSYFLQFGAYSAYHPGFIEFKDFTPAGMRAYFWAHWFAWGFWSACVLAACWALSGAVRGPEVDPGDPLSASWALRGQRPERQRFLAWAAVFGLAAVGLTLKWGTIQDGEMFYYNAWFNFAIYYFGALIALAVVSRSLLTRWQASAAAAATWQEILAGVAALALVGGTHAEALQVRDPNLGSTQAFHASVARALQNTMLRTDGRPVPRVLRFPMGLWTTVAGVALQMERADQPFYVLQGWEVFFGSDHAWIVAPPAEIRARGLQNWRFEYLPGMTTWQAEAENRADLVRIVTPILDQKATGKDDHLYARLNVPTVDPNVPGGEGLDFRAGHPTTEYGVAGWCDPEPWGTWTGGTHAVLQFLAKPVPAGAAGVDISLLGVRPAVDPPRLRVQRLQLFFNGEPLETERPLEELYEALTYRVPAERWNRAVAAPVGGRIMLDLELPDAIAPGVLHPENPNPDMRVLGLGLREVHFQTVAETAAGH